MVVFQLLLLKNNSWIKSTIIFARPFDKICHSKLEIQGYIIAVHSNDFDRLSRLGFFQNMISV